MIRAPRSFHLLALLASCLTWVTNAASDSARVRDRALHQLSQGDVKSAVRLVNTALGAEPTNTELRLLLGRIVDFDGKPEAAIRIWREGLCGNKRDYPLLISIADRRRRQSEDGPNVTYKRGGVSYAPATDKRSEDEFKRINAGRALNSYRRALALRPGEPAVLAHIGNLEYATGDYQRALNTWMDGASKFPAEAEFQLGWARTLRQLNQLEDAAAHFEDALRIAPRSTEAHEALAEIYSRANRSEQARQARQRAAFFEWVPPQFELDYDEAHFKTALLLNPRLLGEKPAKDARAKRMALIERLKRDKSDAATAFLALLCHHHEDHGPVEDAIYAELRTRGETGTDHLATLLRNARSTCTARSASHALAEAGSSKILPDLIAALPRDSRPYFHSDVAGAIRKLGDARAVPALVETMNAAVEETKPSSKEDPMNHYMGRLMNRKRCTAALSQFDTPEAHKALEQGFENPQLRIISGVALYKLTGRPAYLQPLTSALDKQKSTYALALAMEILPDVDTPEAARVMQRLKKTREKARK